MTLRDAILVICALMFAELTAWATRENDRTNELDETARQREPSPYDKEPT
jgi:hypothetical protein